MANIIKIGLLKKFEANISLLHTICIIRPIIFGPCIIRMVTTAKPKDFEKVTSEQTTVSPDIRFLAKGYVVP